MRDYVAHIHGVVFDDVRMLYGLVVRKYPATLDTLMAQAIELDTAARLELALHVALCVCGMHARDIVHSYINPDNILVRERPDCPAGRWDAKISDLGMGFNISPCVVRCPARSSSSSSSNSNSNSNSSSNSSTANTRRFKPPEVFAYPDQQRRPPADIYALGCLLYQLFTDRVPFEGHDDVEIKALVLAGRRPEVDEALSTQLRDLIEGCWAQDSSQRPMAYQVVDVLRDLLQRP
jgi:serine/threonine protein kinase